MRFQLIMRLLKAFFHILLFRMMLIFCFLGTPTKAPAKRAGGMKTYLGISFLVVGLYGLISSRFLLGLVFCGAGVILVSIVDFMKQTRSDNP